MAYSEMKDRLGEDRMMSNVLGDIREVGDVISNAHDIKVEIKLSCTV